MTIPSVDDYGTVVEIDLANVEVKDFTTVDGYKYCFTTTSGYFVIRRNGKIAITGNSGKSYLMQLMPLLLIDDPKTTCIMFRRTTPQLTGQGGIWDTANNIMRQLPPHMRPTQRLRDLVLTFPDFTYKGKGKPPDGATIKFSHMQHVDDMLNHQGLQYSFVGFDEGTQFEWEQIEYLMSRLRSESKHFSRMVISCNPDPDHKIKEMIEWYLDEDGYPDPSKDGVVRYFITENGDYFWADTKEELIEQYGCDPEDPLSFTFVSATIEDNPPMMKNNPRYVSFLKGLNPVDKARLLYGNWNVRPESATYFNRNKLIEIEQSEVPEGLVYARGWDLASQQATEANKDMDFSASIKMGRDPKTGYYYIFGDFTSDNYDRFVEEYGRFRKRSGERDAIIISQGQYDNEINGECTVVLPVDPAAAGKIAFEEAAKRLIGEGLRVRKDPVPVNKSKLSRYMPFCDAVEAGLVRIVNSTFPDQRTLDSYLSELERFTGERSGRNKANKDDRVDATATVFNYLTQAKSVKIVRRNQNKTTTMAAKYLSSRN